MALWFECKVRFDKMMENGSVKKVTEPYLVDALSFTEAEARITEEMRPFISGDFSIPAIKKTNIAEIFYNECADKWWSVKYNIIAIDEKSQQRSDGRLSMSWYRPTANRTLPTLSTRA